MSKYENCFIVQTILRLKMFKENIQKLVSLYQLFKIELSNKPWKEDYNEVISAYVVNLIDLRFTEVENYRKFHSFMKKFNEFLQSYQSIATKGWFYFVIWLN